MSYARSTRRNTLDELVARVRFEMRLHLAEPAATSQYDELAAVFTLGHHECAALLADRRALPRWERRLLTRFARRLYGSAIVSSVADVPPGTADLARAFPAEIAWLRPGSGDPGVRYDLQGRGLLTVFRLAVGASGERWPDRAEVASAVARNVLACSAAFLRRSPWHVMWPVYRVRGLRLWRL
ncbi:hypothetical protein [Amycolatopsis benzoatilytica]|uniref:hypothetical protein n=1 Tax=Amycolatopsis benzoatilytica TaxID=346045 RepID=UPI0005506E2E|nr:hypothetical protein [Amycolatopsis benzoatilytica]